MSQRPQLPIHQNEEKRVAREASARKEERAKAKLLILQEQSEKADADRKDEERHKKIERRIWSKQLTAASKQIKAAKHLNIVTSVAAVFAFGSVIAVIVSIYDARDATVEANRAWLAPDVIRGSNFKLGEKVRYTVSYQNVGRGPATDMHWLVVGGSIPAPPNGDGAKINLPRNETCDGLEPVKYGGVEYPSGSVQDEGQIVHKWSGDTANQKHPFFVDQNILDGKTFFSLVGCVAYTTLKQTRHTAFCYFVTWAADANGARIIGPDGIPGTVIGSCPTGNFAE